MTKKNHNILEIPVEFKIACAVSNFRIRDVLQSFLNHVSWYLYYNDHYVSGFREATYSLKEYFKDHHNHKSSKSLKRYKEKYIKLFNDFYELNFAKRTKPDKRIQKCSLLIKNFLNDIELFISVDKIYLNEEQPLILSDDFKLACEVFNIKPKDFIEYFMSKVDLADYYARGGDNQLALNPSQTFFMLLRKGFNKLNNEREEMDEDEKAFIEREMELHVELYIFKDVELRKEIYNEFYLEYFNAINHNNYGIH